MESLEITDININDIRFPTSKTLYGSDALHKDPDYSCVYVTLHTRGDLKGYGLTFTLGRGNEIVAEATRILSQLIKNKNLKEIWENFSQFLHALTNDPQIRWLGPEKGVIHLAVAAIVNSIWDAWARFENKPLWKLLCDMSPEKLISTIDFSYVEEILTPKECIEMLKQENAKKLKSKRIKEMKTTGFPAYTTSAGWLGYSDKTIESKCKESLQQGFKSFKIKVGKDSQDNKRRCQIVRETIGYDRNLMLDANQSWGVEEAIKLTKDLSDFKPLWIEEPTSPDDVIAHAVIARELKPLNIGVATGEMCQNRVMFKQFFQAKAMSYCQIDSARVAGVNENLLIYMMAKKFGVPVCPHGGGVGLCEMIQHLQVWNYVSLTGSTTNSMIEWVDSLHDKFHDPPTILNAGYVAPKRAGFSTELKEEEVVKYEFPNGECWRTKSQDIVMLSQ